MIYDPAALGSTSFDLKRDNHFIFKTYSDFGPVMISKGFYLLIKDTLILSYDNLKAEERLRVVKQSEIVDSLGNISNDTYLSIDMNFPATALLMRGNEVVKGMLPDSARHLEIYLTPCSQIDEIKFAWLTDTCVIKPSDFKGHRI